MQLNDILGDLKLDLEKAELDLDEHMVGWRKLDEIRQDVIVELTLYLGIEGLMKLKGFLKRLNQGDYMGAAGALRLTVPRADKLANMIKDGIREL